MSEEKTEQKISEIFERMKQEGRIEKIWNDVKSTPVINTAYKGYLRTVILSETIDGLTEQMEELKQQFAVIALAGLQTTTKQPGDILLDKLDNLAVQVLEELNALSQENGIELKIWFGKLREKDVTVGYDVFRLRIARHLRSFVGMTDGKPRKYWLIKKPLSEEEYAKQLEKKYGLVMNKEQD
jgi:hypothetical protein